MIVAESADGKPVRQIAAAYDHSRTTVRDYARGRRIPGEEARADGFEPFATYCRQRLADDPHLRALALLAEVSGLGLDSSSRASFYRALERHGLRAHPCPDCRPAGMNANTKLAPARHLRPIPLPMPTAPVVGETLTSFLARLAAALQFQDIEDGCLKTYRTAAARLSGLESAGPDAPRMSKARLVITAVIVEKRPVSEVARSYGVARSWIYTLLARYQAEGEAAFEPRSRRPKSSPSAIGPDAAGLIVRLRKELAGQGLDAGPHTIAWHLQHHHQVRVSAATISRHLTRAGLVTPDPAKRPRSSYLRFEADQPNECWQADFTHYPLAGGTGTEILSWLDDHSRYALPVTAHVRVTGPLVLAAFRAACDRYGAPASTLTDIQRHGVHHPAIGRQRRPQRPGA